VDGKFSPGEFFLTLLLRGQDSFWGDQEVNWEDAALRPSLINIAGEFPA
jgi:hypothetical protein